LDREKQSQTNPNLLSLAPSTAGGFKTKLKKQSQFVPDQIDSKSFLLGVYGNKPARQAEKNKAKQTQSRLAPRPALWVEKTKPIYIALYGTKERQVNKKTKIKEPIPIVGIGPE
jgi:hypothetical protein